ncbi:MAG: DNA-directed RNA polymerase subunit beta' [Patescibacteria group bacterium]
MEELVRFKDFDAIKIYLASMEDILAWSKGEVTKPETINYRTFKAEKDGLFDERIFGPIKDYECYCGKYKRIRYKGVICDKCGVEVTHSRVRRERMGHIKLSAPVAHVWFFKSIPSKMAILLDMTPRSLEGVVYFSSYIVKEINNDKKVEVLSSIEKDLLKAKEDINSQVENDIKTLEKETEEKIKVLNGKESNHKEFAAEELRLKMREASNKLRDQAVVKQDKIEKDFKALERKIDGLERLSIIDEAEYVTIYDYVNKFCKMGIGAESILEILEEVDLTNLAFTLKEEMRKSKGQKFVKLSKRLRVVEGFRRGKIDPRRMILGVVPVIPPDLRPMVQLEGGRFATSDLNDLYRRVINRNNRLSKLLELGAPEVIVRNEKRMLQESVDALLDSSKQRQTPRNLRGKQQLKSLSDMLKGKQGRFRQNLLGKRVDYSGRSVIVNGPELNLDEVGLPKEMALELFKPFVLREVLSRGFAPNVKSARFFVDSRSAEVWDILEEVIKGHPILLNRAPTLWRLGIQAFYPKLVEGNAISLHLCVCAGYNADFDGDQMAVHVPLSEEAVREAREVMISTNNLLKPSDGTLISGPARTMLLGTYYLTAIDERIPEYNSIFSSREEALLALGNSVIKLRQKIRASHNGEILETCVGRFIFNDILPLSIGFVNSAIDKKTLNTILNKILDTEPNAVLVKFIDAVKSLGLEYGTLSGISVALSDCFVPEERVSYIDEGRKQVADVERNYKRGLITRNEARRLIESIWIKTTAVIDELAWNKLEKESPVKILIGSGASKASRDQLKQIAGMVGLKNDPTGKTVELPIIGNYKEGLTGVEYFASSRGARKGLADRALKTADSGYLTRRLVDVAQDVIVRTEDCATSNHRVIKASDKTMLTTFSDKIAGRYAGRTILHQDKMLVEKDELITTPKAKEIEKLGVMEVAIRSILTCEARHGVCAKCYGIDLMDREVAEVGTAVGVAAAQSIGEPGTQLTMRTFHSGGIAGKDITMGLPRVEELFEARTPKDFSIMSEITGKVRVDTVDGQRSVTVVGDKTSEVPEVTYKVDTVSEILVKDGDIVSAGEPLTSGHLDLSDLLRTVGVATTQKYIIDEVQKVYSSQGVTINDKHLEVIVRQMFNRVKIDTVGDTSFLSGEIVTKYTFQEENRKVLSEGGEPATGELTLLGITRASLETESFLAAASFIQTSQVLTDAASCGKVDKLLGLKENVIVGRLIPTGERARLE